MTPNTTAVLIITIPAAIAAIHHHQLMLKHGRLRTGGSRTAPTHSQYHKQEAALHRIALFTAVLIPILLATAVSLGG